MSEHSSSRSDNLSSVSPILERCRASHLVHAPSLLCGFPEFLTVMHLVYLFLGVIFILFDQLLQQTVHVLLQKKMLFGQGITNRYMYSQA